MYDFMGSLYFSDYCHLLSACRCHLRPNCFYFIIFSHTNMIRRKYKLVLFISRIPRGQIGRPREYWKKLWSRNVYTFDYLENRAQKISQESEDVAIKTAGTIQREILRGQPRGHLNPKIITIPHFLLTITLLVVVCGEVQFRSRRLAEQ